MSQLVDVGVDLGTTVTKAVALGLGGEVRARATIATQWDAPRPNWAQRDAGTVHDVVDELLRDVVDRAGDVVVRSVGFASIAETGALVDRSGRSVSPLIAWHDPRGGLQAQGLDPAVAAAFPARTGLPVNSVATLFKLLWLRDEAGCDLRGLQWLSLPELVCHRLGAERVSERSLLGRTGLWDIHDDAAFAPALAALGVGPELVPPPVAAGAAVGRIRGDHPVTRARGAVLTIAGHDHLVAAAAVGAGAVGTVCDSIGTAEALVAAVPAPPEPAEVARLVARGLAVYPHVVQATTCLLGALRTGLVLGRALDLLGMSSTDSRFAFDAEAQECSRPAEVVLDGLAMGADSVLLEWAEGEDPYAVWAAVLGATRAVVRAELETMRSSGVDVSHLVVTGGWAHLGSVMRSREGLAEDTRRVHLEEPGAAGAALFGRWAATRHPDGTDPSTHHGPHAGWFQGPSA
ncbi:MAG: FGGY family carbohydrate kinase [Ornithinibacter sp.]